MEGRLGSAGKIDRQANEREAVLNFLDSRLLNELGRDNPFIVSQPVFIANAQKLGFETRRGLYVSEDFAKKLVEMGNHGAFDAIANDQPLGERQDRAFAALCFGLFTNARDEQIGKVIAYSRSGTAKLRREFMTALKDYSGEGASSPSPEGVVFQRKGIRRLGVSHSSQEFRDNVSKAKGGLRGQVRQLVADGITDPVIISERLGEKIDKVRPLIQRLRRQGADGLSISARARNKEMAEKMRLAWDRKSLDKIFAENEVTPAFTETYGDLFYSWADAVRIIHGKVSSRAIPALHRLASEAGIYSFETDLRYLIPKQEIKVVKNFIRESCDLLLLSSDPTYRQIAGPEIVRPTHPDIRVNYRGIMEDLQAREVFGSVFLSDCPFPIFFYPRKGLSISGESYDEFFKWVDQKVAEQKILNGVDSVQTLPA